MGTFHDAFITELKAIDKDIDADGVRIGGTEADNGAEPFVKAVPRALAGLVLSGGGIRSATFNLGLLQGMAERKAEQDGSGHKTNILLEIFDYVSTVSGGGYIGSFWSAWRRRNPGSEMFPTECPPHGSAPAKQQKNAAANNDAVMSTSGASGAISRPREPKSAAAAPATATVPAAPGETHAEPDAIRHLREFSRFLAPRWGLFEIETWQFFGGALSAMIPTVIVGFSVLALLIWSAIAISRSTMGGRDDVKVGDYVSLFFPFSYYELALVVTAAATLIVLWAYERETRKIERQADEQYYGWVYAVFAVIGVGVALSVHGHLLQASKAWEYFEVAPGVMQPPLVDKTRFFAPVIAITSAIVVIVFARVILSRFVDSPKSGFFRAPIDRVLGRLVAIAVFWTSLVLFIFGALILWTRNAQLTAILSTIVGGGAGTLFGYLQKLLSRQPSRARGGIRAYAERYALPLLATTALTAAALGVTCLIFTVVAHDHAIAGVVTPAVVVLFAIFAYNANEVGLHPLYRSRLSRAYLGASNAHATTAAQNRQSMERPDDDLPMENLPESRPIHLVCCAANNLSGDHLSNLNRGARSAALSRFGFALANRFQTWNEAPAKVTLATAMTASGAAFNSNMGSLSVELGPAATFLMAALNLRLGYWYHLTRRRHRWCPGLDLFLEMFSQTDSGVTSESIHLSDGGHFENLAVYELLRRKTRYILVSDCGADPDSNFDDLGNAFRRAREDFGVEIAIDISPLKPDSEGISRQHVAVGDITYPDGDRGILLLVKPAIVGDEPADVLQYKARNSSFPHESTGDQFYDEKQWESYRRLGLHTSRIAFRFLDERDAPNTLNASDVFGAAREEWLPIDPSVREQLMQRAGELAAIERQVVSLGNLNLLRDLYPELPWDEKAPHLDDLAPTELAKVIPLFTQVLQLMTNVYVSCRLRQSWSHPLNIGWINWFGRWSTIPAFRDLWPFLSPMFNPDMRDFFEDRFELRSAGTPAWSDGRAVPRTDAAPGVALELWKAMHPNVDRSSHKKLSYRVRIRHGRDVEVAILFYKEEDGKKVWTETWNDPDFFVPPSYWQAGIGKAFLKQIGPGIVRIIDDPARRKEVSDTVQMYSEAKFRLVRTTDRRIEMERK